MVPKHVNRRAGDHEKVCGERTQHCIALAQQAAAWRGRRVEQAAARDELEYKDAHGAWAGRRKGETSLGTESRPIICSRNNTTRDLSVLAWDTPAGRSARRKLENTELIAGVVGHFVGRPRRVEHDLDFDRSDLVELLENLLAVAD